MIFLIGVLSTELFRVELHVPPPFQLDPRLVEMDEAIGVDEWDDE